MQLTQKIRIDPAPEQEDALWHLSEKCRLIYNFALKERKNAEERGEHISYITQQNDLPNLKKKFPEYNWVYSKVLQMTSSNTLKCVVSDYDGTTTTEVAPRKPFHLNFSFKNRSRLMPKSLMYGSLNGTTSTTATTFKSGGGRYDYKRISALQSSKIQLGCEDCNSEDRFSLQIQHQLPFNMDTEVSQEAVSG